MIRRIVTSFPKPSKTARVAKQRQDRTKRQRAEQANKAEVRRRDRYCRFPLCGCGRMRLPTHVSHQRHKGMGGNPVGDRSLSGDMILLCVTRHQDGRVSRHHGTLSIVPLTDKGMAGPVGWWADADAVPGPIAWDRWTWSDINPSGSITGTRWILLARELAPHRLEYLTADQARVLTALAEEMYPA